MAEMEMENGQMKDEGGQAPSAGEIIANVDTLMGVLAKAITEGPAPDDIKKRMAALQQEFRSIMQDLSSASQGGGGASQGQASQGPSPQPVRGQGTPMGMY